MSEGERLAASLATPYERLQKDVSRYTELLKSGAISQETYNRAVKDAKATYDSTSASGQAYNKLLAEGQAIEKASLTPQEQLNASIKRYDALLKVGVISQQTYNRAVEQARTTYASTNAAEKQRLSLMQEGAALQKSLIGPQEQLAASLAKYNQLLKAGAINQSTYNKAVAQAHATYRTASDGATGLFGKLSAVNRVALGFGVGFSAIAVVAGLKSAAAAAIEYGDEIQKASDKTGVGAGDFSQLAYAAKQNDIEIAALNTSFKKLQVTVSEAGSGNKGALATFRALGIEFEELRKLKPDQQFEVIAEQISKLPDPADRARAAVEVFGRAGADLLPLLTQGAEGIRKLREESVKMGASLTDEQAKKLAEVDDQIKRMKQSWSGLARTLTAEVAPALAKVFDQMADAFSDSRESQLRKQIALLKEFQGRGALILAAGPDVRSGFMSADEIAKTTAELERRLRVLNRSFGPGGRDRTSGEDARGAPPGFVDEEAQEKARQAAHMKGIEEIAVTVQKVTVSATEQLYRELEESTRTALEKQVAEWETFDQQVRELVSSKRISAEEGEKRISEHNKGFLEEIEVTAQRIDKLSGAATAYAYQIEYLTDQLVAGAISQDEFNKKVIEADEAYKKAGQAATKANVFLEEASRNVQDIIAQNLINGFEEGAKGMLRAFAEMLKQMAAQALAAQIAKKIFGSSGVGSGGGWIGQAAGFIGGLFGGTRDVGGRGEAGKAYAIGRGAQPEIFVPDEPGTFIPATQWAAYSRRAFQQSQQLTPRKQVMGMPLPEKLVSDPKSWFNETAQYFARMEKVVSMETRDGGGRGVPGVPYMIGAGAQPERYVPDSTSNIADPSEWAGGKTEVKLRNINAFEPSVIRDYLLSSDGEEVLLNFIDRNGSRVRAATAR